MAWPKGRPRKPQQDPQTPLQALAAAEKAKVQEQPAPRKKPLMRARPNWDDVADPEIADENGALHIPRDMFPPDFDFQWVVDTVLGQADRGRVKQERGLWTPVHQEDFDGIFDGMFMAKGAPGEITVDGVVLMARPLKYSIAAKRREQQEARDRVARKEQELRGGDMPGVSMDTRHPSALRSNVVNKTIERVDIPRDE